MLSPTNAADWYFYPRPPRGGRQQWMPDMISGMSISIHVLREEDDRQAASH